MTLNMVIECVLRRECLQADPSWPDERIVIEYMGKKVAIATYGDGPNYIDENIRFFESVTDVDICISATWSRGETIKKMEAFAKKHNAPLAQILKTYNAEKLLLANTKDAKKIVGEILRPLTGQEGPNYIIW